MTPFDFINSINNKSEKIVMDEIGRKDYAPFIINRGLSNNIQTVMFANETNKMAFTPKEWQYDFLYHGVPKGKRFDKWAKKEKSSEDVDAVKEFYHINNSRAEEALAILSSDQVDIIKQKLRKGGKNA